MEREARRGFSLFSIDNFNQKRYSGNVVQVLNRVTGSLG